MGRVQKLNNSIVVDGDTISKVWWCLNQLADPDLLDNPLSEFEELQNLGRDLSRNVAIKMKLQECELSEDVVRFCDELSLEEFNQTGDANE